MKAQNVPTYFITEDFIYIPFSWIISKPSTHTGHAAYTIYICVGKRWKKALPDKFPNSFLINPSPSAQFLLWHAKGKAKFWTASPNGWGKWSQNVFLLLLLLCFGLFFWEN